MNISDKKNRNFGLIPYNSQFSAWLGFSYNTYMQNQNFQNIGGRLKSLEDSSDSAQIASQRTIRCLGGKI